MLVQEGQKGEWFLCLSVLLIPLYNLGFWVYQLSLPVSMDPEKLCAPAPATIGGAH
jgi:hypothetical protein